jgi:Domain of unknown function (DUF222)
LLCEHLFGSLAGVGIDVVSHLDRIREELADLVAVAPAEVPSPVRIEALVALEQLCSQLDAVKLAVTGAWDAAADWAYDGALSGTAWLRANTAVSSAEARWQVRTARALLAAPTLDNAYLTGQLTTSKVRSLAPLALGDTAELFARDEKLLVAQAIGLTAGGVARQVRYWQALADDELSRPDQTADRQDAADGNARRHHPPRALPRRPPIGGMRRPGPEGSLVALRRRSGGGRRRRRCSGR